MSAIDIEAMSISVLGCGGVENIPDFADLAKKMKISFCAITDKDLDGSGMVKEKTKNAREKISKLKSSKDEMVEWDNNLEDCLLTPIKQNSTERKKANPEWQRDNVFVESLDKIKSKYPKYNNVCKSIVQWLGVAQ